MKKGVLKRLRKEYRLPLQQVVEIEKQLLAQLDAVRREYKKPSQKEEKILAELDAARIEHKELSQKEEKILAQLEKVISQKNQILDKAINETLPLIKPDETNDIYMYRGSYHFGNNKAFFEQRGSATAEIATYHNIEQIQKTKVPTYGEGQQAFESTEGYLVIVPEEYSKDYSYVDEDLRVQRLFFGGIILSDEKNPQAAVKKELARSFTRKNPK